MDEWSEDQVLDESNRVILNELQRAGWLLKRLRGGGYRVWLEDGELLIEPGSRLSASAKEMLRELKWSVSALLATERVQRGVED